MDYEEFEAMDADRKQKIYDETKHELDEAHSKLTKIAGQTKKLEEEVVLYKTVGISMARTSAAFMEALIDSQMKLVDTKKALRVQTEVLSRWRKQAATVQSQRDELSLELNGMRNLVEKLEDDYAHLLKTGKGYIKQWNITRERLRIASLENKHLKEKLGKTNAELDKLVEYFLLEAKRCGLTVDMVEPLPIFSNPFQSKLTNANIKNAKLLVWREAVKKKFKTMVQEKAQLTLKIEKIDELVEEYHNLVTAEQEESDLQLVGFIVKLRRLTKGETHESN